MRQTELSSFEGAFCEEFLRQAAVPDATPICRMERVCSVLFARSARDSGLLPGSVLGRSTPVTPERIM